MSRVPLWSTRPGGPGASLLVTIGLSGPTCTLIRTADIERVSPAAIIGPCTWPPAVRAFILVSHPGLGRSQQPSCLTPPVRSSATCGWNGRAGSSPSTGPKASMSGLQRLAQLRPGPVATAMSSPAGPAARVAACTASRSWSSCFHSSR
jgi:hypothetical protein